MNTKLTSKLVIGFLLFTLIAALPAPVHAERFFTPLKPGGGSSIIPIIGLVGSWFRRNRTYRNAESFITYQKQYYDNQIKTLDQQIAKGTIYTGPQGNSPEAQKAAYTKVKALLAQDRDMALAFAESIKKGARHDFNQAAKDAVKKIVLSTGFAQNLLGGLVKGFGQAQRIVDGALNELQGSGSIASRIRGLNNLAANLNLVGGLIGGKVGHDINTTVQGITDKVNQGVNFTTNELNNLKQQLANVQDKVQKLKDQGYVATSSEVTDALAARLVGLGPGTPATEAILNILSARTGTSAKDIRERGQQLLAAGANARCRKILTDLAKKIKELNEDTGDQDDSDANGETCTEISDDDLTGAEVTETVTEESPAEETGNEATVEEPTETQEATATQPNTTGFMPFTEEDCRVPGYTGPAHGKVSVTATTMDCPFMQPAGGSPVGFASLTIVYYDDPAAARADYDNTRKTVEADMVGGRDSSVVLVDTNTEFFFNNIMPSDFHPNPNLHLSAVELYNDHFVIYFSLSLEEVIPNDGAAMGEGLITYSEGVADKHLPQ